MPELKLRPKTLVELTANARFLVAPRPLQPDEKAARLLNPEARRVLAELLEPLKDVEWRSETLEEKIRSFADERGVKLGSIAQPLRAALTGSAASPGIFMVMEVLGRQETLGRIADARLPGIGELTRAFAKRAQPAYFPVRIRQPPVVTIEVDRWTATIWSPER
jgi:glutamyl-tRNA synthetase